MGRAEHDTHRVPLITVEASSSLTRPICESGGLLVALRTASLLDPSSLCVDIDPCYRPSAPPLSGFVHSMNSQLQLAAVVAVLFQQLLCNPHSRPWPQCTRREDQYSHEHPPIHRPVQRQAQGQAPLKLSGKLNMGYWLYEQHQNTDRPRYPY
ncbi:hypothetical protein BKA70DRAFT_1569470 [Coprinopsis sp. MPI-PUGE-AT-0042]|nr:hypothetical protein BKA70DRAFT_1569470 [Coprinopsis sp. MPI-PUGE-AT-0042]